MRRRAWRPPSVPFVLSIAIHAAVVALVLPMSIIPHDLGWMLATRAESEMPAEQIRYATIPARASSPPTVIAPRRPSGRLSPTRETQVASAVPAPGAIADGIPRPVPLALGGDSASGATGTGRGGSLVPGTDSRIWGARADWVAPETTHAEQLARPLARVIKAGNDSIAAALVRRPPGPPRWVADRGGLKFGVDKDAIHIGKLSVPPILLGLLPVRGFGCYPAATIDTTGRLRRNVPGTVCMQQENPNIEQRARRISEMGAEIRERGTLQHDVREEVARIEDRMKRESAARLAGQRNAAAGAATSGRGSPPPGELR